jgi:hypothetical protein
MSAGLNRESVPYINALLGRKSMYVHVSYMHYTQNVVLSFMLSKCLDKSDVTMQLKGRK